MKLNEFFQTQKNLSFTDVDKLELYQKFLHKKTVGSPVKRFSFVHAKAFIYTLIIAFLFIGLYGVYFFNDGERWFVSNTVQADYIAKVVSFSGSFSIEHLGKVSQTENISNGDTIILKEKSEMIFQINSGTESKIIGPAKLTIQKFDDDTAKYKLNLIYGDYIQMENTRDPQNIELAIDDILIKQADNTQPLSFQFVNEGEGHILKNNGSSLMVTKNGDIQETEIKNKQVLTIQNSDIQLFNSWEGFTEAVQKGDVSQTFAVQDSQYTEVKTSIGDTSTGEKEESPLSLMTLLFSTENEKISTETSQEDMQTISEDIESLLGSNKTILTPEQNNALRSALGSYTLTNEMKDAYATQLVGGDSIAKIKTKITQLYNTFRISYPNDTLANNIANFSKKLNESYDIPPAYITNLGIINNRLGVLTSVSADSPSREEFQAAMPSNLIFK